MIEERESLQARIAYKTENLILTFGNVKQALKYQENVVKSLDVIQYPYNPNTLVLRLLEKFAMEKEREINLGGLHSLSNSNKMVKFVNK